MMKVELNKQIADAVVKAAEENGVTVEEFVNGLLHYSFDSGLAIFHIGKVEELLAREILPRIMKLEMNSFATRHQILNLHADISDGPERAEAIAKEANEIAYSVVFEEDENEE